MAVSQEESPLFSRKRQPFKAEGGKDGNGVAAVALPDEMALDPWQLDEEGTSHLLSVTGCMHVATMQLD